ncbi:MAG: DNA mismatch repair endonuclease MutL [Candidatus Schekmanbacteria bacterium]|nr:DNA mismatch repair endonuclease MutL [Candidatus Schekmanbacteria bacterium]
MSPTPEPGTGKIRRLPDYVANRIAAGEVVERPASVVKELLENALDAGATRVTVQLEQGGVAAISVSDDGCGMSRGDAEIAFERHATSKIAVVEDLERIRTLGFRGEALPAIASVSQLTLKTCDDPAGPGVEVRYSAGKKLSVEAIGFPVGTAVEVANLFFATPARRKFLRSRDTELAHCTRMVLLTALANPGVGFRLLHDRRELLGVPPGHDLGGRVCALAGSEIARQLVAVPPAGDGGDGGGGVVVTGMTGLPSLHRAGRTEQHFFVNRRPIADRGLTRALYEAYQSALPSGRHPVCYLFLDVSPELVDVNVHPAKSEVRFRRPGEVQRAVVMAIRRAVGSAPGAAMADESVFAPGLAYPPAAGGGAEATAGAFAFGPLVLHDPFAPGVRPTASAYPWPTAGGGSGAATAGGGASAASLAAAANAGAAEPLGPARLPFGLQPHVEGQRGELASLPILGQILNTYIVLGAPSGLLIVDQHVAHERVLFDAFRRALKGEPITRQRLLTPPLIELPAEARAGVAANLPSLRQVGFDLEPFGEHAYVLRAAPVIPGVADALKLLHDIIDDLRGPGGAGAARRHVETAREELIARMSCRSAVMAGRRLDEEEMRALLARLVQTEQPYTCPHGRPVVLELHRSDIERAFARR